MIWEQLCHIIRPMKSRKGVCKATKLLLTQVNEPAFLRVYQQWVCLFFFSLVVWSRIFVHASLSMLTDYPMQVLSILTLAGFASYQKNLFLEDAFSQNMLGSFLLVRSLLAFFTTITKTTQPFSPKQVGVGQS